MTEIQPHPFTDPRPKMVTVKVAEGPPRDPRPKVVTVKVAEDAERTDLRSILDAHRLPAGHVSSSRVWATQEDGRRTPKER